MLRVNDVATLLILEKFVTDWSASSSGAHYYLVWVSNPVRPILLILHDYRYVSVSIDGIVDDFTAYATDLYDLTCHMCG